MKIDTLQVLIDLQKWRTEKVISPSMPSAGAVTAALADAIAELEKRETWQPGETAPKDRVILADVGYPWPLSCLWDAECDKWAVAFLNCETKDEAAKESRNVYWETEWEGKIMRWMEVPKL